MPATTTRKPTLTPAQKKAARAASRRTTPIDTQVGETEDNDAIEAALQEAQEQHPEDDARPSKPARARRGRNTPVEAAESATTPPTPPQAPKAPNGPALMRLALEHTGRPMHSAKITEWVLANGGDKIYGGLTPAATMAAQLATSNKAGHQFIRVAPGIFGLRAWTDQLKLEPIPADPTTRTPRAAKPAPSPAIEELGNTLCRAIDQALQIEDGTPAPLDSEERAWLAGRVAGHIKTLA